MKEYKSTYEIDKDFQKLRYKYFNITNSYITGVITKSEVDKFGKFLQEMREAVDKVEMTDENMYFLAKVKSKLQHCYTEIMEDEELLAMAYKNEI